MFLVSGGCHVLPSYSLVLYVIANTQKHFFSPPGSQSDPKASDTWWICWIWWILYSRGRVWVQYLSFAVGHRRMPFRRWPTQFRSIYIYSVYVYVLFISKRVWGHFGELISVKFRKFRTNWDISVLFEDSTSVEAPPPMGGVWVVGWVDGWGQVKSLKIKYTLT